MINRLIIVGNGFDIAHGLKTKYGDFMQDYYSKIEDSGNWNDDFFECNLKGFQFKDCDNLDKILQYLGKRTGANIRENAENIEVGNSDAIKIKSPFFYKISKSHSIQNWVDIENEYFKSLLKIIDRAKLKIKDIDAQERTIRKQVSDLNKEMDAVAKTFEKYLISHVVPEMNNLNTIIENLLHDRINVNSGDLSDFAKEFPKKYTDGKANFDKKNYSDIYTDKYTNTLILNFNYTHTFEFLYRFKIDKLDVINIHGSIKNTNNPINLGFGDEMSKRYGEIEDFNENEYLRLMKSFAYSNTNNYKRLFDFIESDDFQVQIMGHSCGTSDRTLLNAIFENHNCKSIKVFYHAYEGEDGKIHDNYSDIVRNISRHFNQKTMMRDRIVNKENTRPLIS